MNAPLPRRTLLRLGSREFDLASRTHIMGIINVTPDSFSDGGAVKNVDDAVRIGLEMQAQGADVIDVGGESSRPGSDPVSAEEEMRRVIPVVERLVKRATVPVSIDTRKADVARAAVESGAAMVNDISAGMSDPAMIPYVASAGVALVLMHMKGTPKTMQKDPQYKDVSLEVTQFLLERAQFSERAGVHQIVIDPGLGFGKTVEHNLRLIKDIPMLASSGLPILVGPSRKSFIGSVLDLPLEERLEGTAAAVAACIFFGAHIIRVHDVRFMKRVASMCDVLKPVPTRSRSEM